MTYVPKDYIPTRVPRFVQKFLPKIVLEKFRINYAKVVIRERKRITKLNRGTTLLPDDHPSRVKKGEIIPLAGLIMSLEPGEFMKITEDFRNIMLGLPLKNKELEKKYGYPLVEQTRQDPK